MEIVGRGNCNSLISIHGRRQFVKIGNSVSSTTVVGVGSPQVTVSGPKDFKLVINDLTFNTCYAKYVDDTILNDFIYLSNFEMQF